MSNQNLPTRFHIGTQKAGSTFLYNLLSSHPDISLSTQTEVHYYHKFFDRGQDWYLSLFPEVGVKVDTSPKYLMNGPVVAQRIKEAVGEGDQAKFLLILRNPIDFINSHYQMHAISGHFHNHRDRYPIVPENVVDYATRYPECIKQANYYALLKESWLQHFDSSQFKVVIFEDFVKNNEKVISEILTFWDLPPRQLTAPKTSQNKMLKNRFLFELKSRVVKWAWLKKQLKQSRFLGGIYDSYLTESSGSKISPKERQDLAIMFKKDVADLESWLGYQVTAWQDFH